MVNIQAAMLECGIANQSSRIAAQELWFANQHPIGSDHEDHEEATARSLGDFSFFCFRFDFASYYISGQIGEFYCLSAI